MSHGIAVIENGLPLKLCYNCGGYRPSKETEHHKWTCSKCEKDTKGNNYYINKYTKINGGI